MSDIACPSLKNSGMEATSNFAFSGFAVFIISYVFLFVPTGTVLFVTITVYPSRFSPIFLATSKTTDKSASPVGLGGVPTAIKTASEFEMDSL